MSRKEEHHLRQWSSSPIGDQRNVSWGKKERPDKVSSNLMQDLITSYGMKDFSPSSKNDRMIEVMEGEPASDIGPMLSDASSSGPVKQKRLPARRRILNEVSTLNSLMDTQLSVLRDESIFDEGVQFVGDRALTTTITTTTKTPSTPVRRNSSLTANEQLLLAGVSTNIHRKRKRESQKGDIQMVQDIRPGSLHSAVNFKVDATSSSIIRETMQTLHVGSVQEGLDSASLKRKYLDKEEAPFHPMKSVLPLPLGNDQDDAQQFLTGQPRKRFCQKVPVRVGSSHLDGGTYTFKPPLPIAGQKPQSRKLIPQSPQLRSAHQDFSGSNGAHRDNVHSPTAYRTKSREVEASHTPFSVQIRENTSDVCEASPVHWNRTKNESPFFKIRLSHWNKWYAIRKF
ncbi:hypothetical protein BC829DRAFT_174815 [Chytridium lagenaria]|nr:hypothetical protein BC829DRAFT_174815 [Chytridium lagenaria]